ncbi:septum formation protein Maf [Candidatus Dojkabacteria bacterium]|uniref:dTTP/UTP pyrophosphatase n=1 Tax=Candidatus Dojkabacteria bacterium TaxID=2099670 RepID=A0A5C7J6F8_9BACT|nr:MAG: septum formation protein Maf [Candidatus Dojkabacteria bacterium]
MKKLILASKSPRRQRILKDAGFTFEIKPADLDEEAYENLPPLEMVKILSKLKAEKIAADFPEALIIGADTTIDLNGKIISKPRDLKHAKEMLKELSGSTHKVFTAYTIVKGKDSTTYYEETQVIFNDLTDEQIEEYIKSIDVLGFAGAYGIQDGADAFVKEIKGDYLNVVGLPTSALEKLEVLEVK